MPTPTSKTAPHDPPATAPRDHKGGMARLSLGLRTLAVATRTFDTMAPDLTTRIMLRHFTRPRRKPGHDYRAQLPAGAVRLALPYNDRELTGWRWGGSGLAVLLVHGWEDHSGSMLPFVRPLLERGYRVFALDVPGHGLSPQVATHLLDCSRAIEAMARAYGPFYSIVGHSYGAAAASVMLARAPALRPGRLALISPMRDMEQHLEVFVDIAMLSPLRTERLRRLVTDVIGCSPAGVSTLEAIRKLDVPGLVIHDRHDPVIPHGVGASIAANWRGASFVSTERLGHRRLLQCPRVLSEVLRLHDGGVRPC